MVIKKDGRREKFDRQKVLAGLLRACEKRLVEWRARRDRRRGRNQLADSPDREFDATEIGEMLMIPKASTR